MVFLMNEIIPSPPAHTMCRPWLYVLPFDYVLYVGYCRYIIYHRLTSFKKAAWRLFVGWSSTRTSTGQGSFGPSTGINFFFFRFFFFFFSGGGHSTGGVESRKVSNTLLDSFLGIGLSPSFGVAGSGRAGACALAGPPEGPPIGGSVGGSTCRSSVSFSWELGNGGVSGGVAAGDCFGVSCFTGVGEGELLGDGGRLAGGDSFLGISFFGWVGDNCAKSADIMDILGFLPPSV